MVAGGLQLDAELAALVGAPTHVAAAPMLRRNAITFKYDKLEPEEWGMSSLSAAQVSGTNNGQTKSNGEIYRDVVRAPTDSWEIELCVGIALRLLVIPNFKSLQHLGRMLLILKVHKDPMVCEIFFMKHEDVLKTYKERMPNVTEYVNLYNPAGEMAFWAELFKPSSGRRTGGRGSSMLTDELCGAFGSRFSMRYFMEDYENGYLEKALDQMNMSEAERSAQADAMNAKIDKAKAKKARQKAAKAAKKEEEAEAAQKAKVEAEEAERTEIKAAKIAAPHLANFDWYALKAKRDPPEPIV